MFQLWTNELDSFNKHLRYSTLHTFHVPLAEVLISEISSHYSPEGLLKTLKTPNMKLDCALNLAMLNPNDP